MKDNLSEDWKKSIIVPLYKRGELDRDISAEFDLQDICRGIKK